MIRAGFGLFYQRLDIIDVLTARPYNGIDQQSFVVTDPDFFPSIVEILSGRQSVAAGCEATKP